MSKEDLPRWMEEFWSENPTEYTKDDIFHLEPGSEGAAYLKYLVINGFAKLTLQLNGKNKGEFNGSEEVTINLNLGNLIIQKNGETIGNFNGDDNVIANISVPVVTYGTGAPSGGKTGDVYMRYS